MNRHPIFVTGAARSGTSMVAQLLHEAGAWVGTTEPGSEENPQGFFENRLLRDGLMKSLLAINGYDHLGVDPLPPIDFSTDFNLKALADRLLFDDGYVRLPDGAPWLFKDAKLLLTWRMWHKAYPDARWVLVRRDRDEIIDSCCRSKFMNRPQYGERNRDFWSNWVDEYLLRMEDLKKHIDYMEVDTNQLLDGNYCTIKDAISMCGLSYSDLNVKSVICPEYWGPDKETGASKRLKLNIGMNARHEDILSNIRKNITLQLPQANIYHPNEQHVALVCGGPSLQNTISELREQYENGTKLIAVNNTHDWLIDHGMKPSMHVMVDSREFNNRFIQKPIDSCKYFMASQCHPSVFEALKDNELYIFHVVNEIGEKEILDDYYFGNYHFVVGGSTVSLRAIWLLRMLGFTKIDLYGFDSCYMDGKHHAYEQPENDDCETREVTCMGKNFLCATWMASQYDDFQHFIAELGDKFELNVHGNGLIAHMMNEGAKLFDESQNSTVGGD